MFERYTEKARRVIFFARYEASQFGSDYIEAEHILLGLLREDTAFVWRLSRSSLSPEDLRRRIEKDSPPREHVSTSIDMPLSLSAKTVLVCAAEEAERLGHQHIGTDHLLLGILRQGTSLAARLLAEAEIELPEVRENLCRSDRHPGRTGEPIPHWNKDNLEIHGELFSFTSVREFSVYYRRFHWGKRRWVPRDALARRCDRKLFLYSGQTYDPEQTELVRGGWKEDHCAICWWKLDASDAPGHSEGYTNGQDWLCTECYERFVKPPPSAA